MKSAQLGRMNASANREIYQRNYIHEYYMSKEYTKKINKKKSHINIYVSPSVKPYTNIL